MEKQAIWSENCTVRFNAIDKSDLMTLNSIFGLFQEAAISHAENLSIGREDMARANQVWILSRMSVQVDRRPKYGEAITVRTWPRGGERIFALRDYDIIDAAGNAAVRARSCWIIIDIEKRRPLRPQSVMDSLPQNQNLDALSTPASLEERSGLLKIAEQPALYTDVDYVGHVNNVTYIRWIENSVAAGLLYQAKRMRLDINFINEILPDEVTDIWSADIEAASEDSPAHVFAFEGRHKKNDSAAFRAELQLW